MAELRATFQADFSSFQDASTKAEVSLKAIETGADKTGVAIDKMTKSLDGTKIKQQADVAATSVENIGGVATLTDKELQKIGRTADQAIEKYKALGEQVPPHLQKLSDAAHDAEKNTGAIGRVAEFVGPQLLAMFSVGALTAWVSGTIDAASHIEDLSRKLDVSHEAIQRWGYAAELSGGTIDDVSSALEKMQKNLGGGSDSTIAALKAVGLEFDSIRAMKPEDAFDAITEAIKNIPDPMTQTRVATELFGKGAASILPAIRDGFREVGSEASVMSEKMIADLDRAGDAWVKLKNKVVIASGAIIGAAAAAFDNPLGDRDIHKAIDEETAALEKSLNRIGALAEKNYRAQFTPAVKDADAAYAAFGATNAENEKKIKVAADAQEDHNKKIKALADTLSGQAVADKARDLGEALKLAGGSAKLSAAQTDAYFKAADALVKGPLGSAGLPKNVRDLWLANGTLALGITQQVVPSLDEFYSHLTGLDKTLPGVQQNILNFLKETSISVQGAWAEEQAAGEAAAKATEKAHKESLAEIERAHEAFARTVVGYTVELVNGMIHGWDGLKSAAINVLNDILNYMIEVFVRKMLIQFALLAAGGAAGVGAGAAGAAGAGAGAAAGAGLGLTVGTTIGGALAPYLIGNLINPGHNLPQPPKTDLEIAQESFNYVGPTGESFLNWMADHPWLWGQGNGFAGGTHGQYLNFGAGTPVMLHGRERVMTEAEGKSGGGAGNGWGPTIVVQTLDGADTERWLRHGGARQIADALGPHLARVIA